MKIADLNGKTVCILGFGKEGRAMLAAIERYAQEAEVTIADQNADIDVPSKYWKQVGTGWLENLDKFNVLIKSPGIPPIPNLQSPISNLTSPTAIFLDSIAGSGATVIGVTGSKGKSTTASLIHHILAISLKPIANSLLIGNIGEPAIAHIADAKPGTVFVMEMSSYQLMDLTFSPHIAVITSFFPEHLDYHGSIEAYWDAKSQIVRHQTENDVVIFNATQPEVVRMANLSPGKKFPVRPDQVPVDLSETQLIGEHNRSNIALACATAREMGVPENTICDAVRSFTPLPHRLQSLGVHHGIEWVDDAISTTPESAIAAIDALGDRVQAIILGGQDRGLDFTGLADRIVHASITTVILFPESGKRIRKALQEAGFRGVMHDVTSMTDAVRTATSHKPQATSHTPIVLLSPASPSYGLFKNFEEKGAAFARAVRGE